eukprot:SAG31_NODE_180_length_21118_cov_62.152671_11_plen_98_part_00
MITVPAAQQIPDVYGILTCVVNTITLPVARPPASEAAPCPSRSCRRPGTAESAIARLLLLSLPSTVSRSGNILGAVLECGAAENGVVCSQRCAGVVV